ncbi:ABC transporter permease [Paucibacter sp. XJ19-41]|uniref:ABC transporter permease n=1 Tax=Paucibacter sp. XJ19-41 TaxID=2927824 RepID=UPI00234ACC9E|nr:ABC transporter permease [Paucibacter sp. XJ19-41]MDC6169050.1 ABC transporter permease [Paucibacter sp. XJ19-41]
MNAMLKRWLETLAFWGLLALLWEFGVGWLGIRRYLLPPLSDVLLAGWNARSALLENTWVTLLEVLVGFAAAVLGGVLLGVLIHLSGFARRTLYPLITALQSMPKIALAPLMIVWFGYGFGSKVAATFLFAFFPIVIATLGGMQNVAINLDEHFRALGASRLDTFWRLQVPAALPAFVDGIKIAMPLAVIGAIVGEFIGAEQGLGHLMTMATANAQTDLMFAAILTITALAVLLYAAVERLAKAVWWRGISF